MRRFETFIEHAFAHEKTKVKELAHQLRGRVAEKSQERFFHYFAVQAVLMLSRHPRAIGSRRQPVATEWCVSTYNAPANHQAGVDWLPVWDLFRIEQNSFSSLVPMMLTGYQNRRLLRVRRPTMSHVSQWLSCLHLVFEFFDDGGEPGDWKLVEAVLGDSGRWLINDFLFGPMVLWSLQVCQPSRDQHEFFLQEQCWEAFTGDSACRLKRADPNDIRKNWIEDFLDDLHAPRGIYRDYLLDQNDAVANYLT